RPGRRVRPGHLEAGRHHGGPRGRLRGRPRAGRRRAVAELVRGQPVQGEARRGARPVSIAYWCLLAAAVLPYAWIVIAKRGGPRYDNRDPRRWLAKQDSPLVQRASAGHQNAFDACPPFAAGVRMAELAGVDPGFVAALAVAFRVCRIAHGLCYLGGRYRARSLAWALGFACVMT